MSKIDMSKKKKITTDLQDAIRLSIKDALIEQGYYTGAELREAEANRAVSACTEECCAAMVKSGLVFAFDTHTVNELYIDVIEGIENGLNKTCIMEGLSMGRDLIYTYICKAADLAMNSLHEDFGIYNKLVDCD